RGAGAGLGLPRAPRAAPGGRAALARVGLGHARGDRRGGARAGAARSGALGGRLPAAAGHGRAVRAAGTAVPPGAAPRRAAPLLPPRLDRVARLPRGNLTNRILGAIDAALLVVLAVAFARRLGAKGAEFAAAAAVIWWGGWLGLFTGYSKAFCELTLVMVASAAFGLDALRDGRRSLALALVVSA